MGIDKNRILRLFNSMAKTKGLEARIDLGEGAKASDQEMQFQTVQAQLRQLDKNFIMENIDNVIRSQLYSNLKSSELVTKDFGFWLTGEQGEQVIYENTIDTSARTGDPVADISLISGEPEVEIQILQLTENQAVDMKTNATLQAWASIQQGLSWILKRFDNMKKSLDKWLHNNMLAEINAYLGYNEVLIDSTGLTNEQLAVAFEIVIGEQMAELTVQYSNDKNNLTFDNVLDTEDVGAIFSIKNAVNRKINYMRRLRNPDDNLDWGMGHIITKPLDDEQQVILLPNNKYIAGATFGSIDSSLGWALIENLRTDYVFKGSIFMESAPAVRITAGTPATLQASLEKKKKSFQAVIAKVEKFISENKAELDEANKLLAKTQLQKLKDFNDKLNIAEIVKNAKTYKYNEEDLSVKVVLAKTDKAAKKENDPKVAKLEAKLEAAQKNLIVSEAAKKQRQEEKQALIKKIDSMQKQLKGKKPKGN